MLFNIYKYNDIICDIILYSIALLEYNSKYILYNDMINRLIKYISSYGIYGNYSLI